LTGDFMRLLAVATWALLPAVALAQAAPSLSLPVACALGSECVLQNYPDAEELRLLGPDGSVPVERRSPVERDLAQWYTYVGKRGGAGAWPSGTYRGVYALYRGESSERVVSLSREVALPGGTGQRPKADGPRSTH
jgi:hypothetical protein